MLYDISYVFYDYIFVCPSLLAEFKGVNLRNDEILLMFSDALKQLAVELDVFVMSSTQVNANADNNKDIRNDLPFHCLSQWHCLQYRKCH